MRHMRVGIVLRLLGILVLASAVVIEGGNVKNRAFEGKSEHYTVVLAANADASAVAKQHSRQGVKVDHIVNNSTTKAYEASMTSSEATKVENDPMVDYIEMDSSQTVHHTWWDTTLITLGMRTPHLV